MQTQEISRILIFLFVFLGAIFYLSHFYCHCDLETGVNQVGWHGLRRIANSKFTNLNKDRMYNYCQSICEFSNNCFQSTNLTTPS